MRLCDIGHNCLHAFHHVFKTLFNVRRSVHNVVHCVTAEKIVAHAFFPNDAHGGNVHFDADETWTVTATKGRFTLPMILYFT